MLIVCLALGNLCLILYDRLNRISANLYVVRIRGKFFK